MVKIRAIFLVTGALLTSIISFSKEKSISASYSTQSVSDNSVQQNFTLSGKVVDKDGFSLPGVSVMVVGKNGVGTITDVNGNYKLDCSREDVLEYSYIGFKTVRKTAGDVDRVTLTMEEDTETLEQVQVVAFGKQKKESVVGSISTIQPEGLRVPATNLTTALAGRMPGIIAYQRSGEPGLDNAEFFIRGVTTFSTDGKKDPLILIDGVEMSSTDLARLNVDDIASFSVMKDANSSALYGARGANGVILVTTKEGSSEKLTINVRAEAVRSYNTKMVELADPITYMRLHNEAVRTRDAMVELPYTSAKIRNTELGTNPVLYPSVDWHSYLLKDYADNQKIHLNLTGGGKAVQYYLAANYQNETGIIKESSENMLNNNIKIHRFQLRSNVTIKFDKNTTGIVRAYGTFNNQTGPSQGGSAVFTSARNATPVRFLPYYPAGATAEKYNHILFGMGDELGVYTNPYAQLMSSYKRSSASTMLLQLEMEHKFTGLLEGTYLKGLYYIKRDSYYEFYRSYNPFYYSIAPTVDGSYQLIALNPDTGTEYLSYTDGTRYAISTQYGEGRLGYNRTFGKHDIQALLVGTIREEVGAGNLNSQDTAAGLLQATLPRRNISTAGRLSYGYGSRYFLEVNFGLNGSERFARSHRWGFFPSVGLGYMISNESFFRPLKNVVSSLKLKATYGLVGNDQIGSVYDRFFYLSQVNMSSGGYQFGINPTTVSGITIQRYANDKIGWETAKKLNIGFELEALNALTVVADYFTEERYNILQTRSDIPSTMGLRAIPQANVGAAKGKGFEVEIKYQKNFTPDTWLVLNVDLTYATSKYTKYEEPDYRDAPWLQHVGMKLNQPLGYIAERLFIDDTDVNNSPEQTFGTYGAGDIKYKDINGDGQIDSDDRVPIGYPTVPEIIYGTGFSFGWKIFDVSCFFQGSERSSFFIDAASITPFINNGQRALLKYIADDHWSENNRDIHAFWPRLSAYAIANNNQTSTWWLHDGGFLRLKAAEFGVTIPERITKKIQVDMLRIYVSGSNLLCWSKFKLWDPEMGENGLGYPLQRVINLGVNITF